MAHFAEINEENIVTQVIVVHNNELLVDGEESETKGIDFFVIEADHRVGVIKKREQDVIYHDDYNNIKNLKFKDFLNLNNQINYIEAEQALRLISPL